MPMLLLPQPQYVRLEGGTLSGPPRFLVAGPGAEEAARCFQPWPEQTLQRAAESRPPPAPPGSLTLEVTGRGAPEGYELRIGRRDIDIRGHDPAGLAHGLATLRQLFALYGARPPRLTIRDRPAFPHRGYSLDISRGRVPRLSTLKALVDRLADWKMNQLQLYVEHVYDFAFDPEIGAGADPLTASELRELDRHARRRHVRLVPSLACFGHMGRVLSLPRYRKLAEVEWPAPDWAGAPWRLRLRGATINPRHPGARRLLQDMLDEYLPLFTAPYFNMCGDETYDLGRGVNARFVARHGLGALYARHVRHLHRLAARHGKRLMLWGDVLRHHPDALPDLPRDAIVLDWGYEPDTPFDRAGRFIEAGLETWVCPATRGYKVVFNEVETARANIAGWARAGVRLGARGLLLTDWGDMGHFNLPACSVHGLALGAAMAWNPAGDDGRLFDRAFSQQVLGDRSGAAGRAFVELGRTGLAEWPRLLREPGHPVSAALARKAARRPPRIEAAARALWSGPTGGALRPVEREEVQRAVEALRLTAQRIALDHDLGTWRDRPPSRAGRPRVVPASLRRRMLVFCDAVDDFVRRYARTWRKAHKRSGLAELRRAFRTASSALRAAAKGRRMT